MASRAIYAKAIEQYKDDPEILEQINVKMRWEIAHRSPSDWLSKCFPAINTKPLAEHHQAFWSWLWGIQDGEEIEPFVAVWARGHAKSTSAEEACACVAGRKTRRYGLYVCDTQDRANDHVESVGALLTQRNFAELYPEAAKRKVGMYGHPKAWRRNRLQCASGFAIDAIGLDVAARGVKLEAERPDFIVLDDLDDAGDSSGVTESKIRALTRAILPAGAQHVAILAVQNLVHPDSIFSRLVDGRAEFLMKRTVSGPHPAITNLEYRKIDDGFEITGGQPTWEGMGWQALQHELNNAGPTAFLAEYQHAVSRPESGIFNHLEYERVPASEIPQLVRTVVWVDPAVTSTDHSDAQAIVVDGIGVDDKIYRGLPVGNDFGFFESRTTPLDALRRAITWAYIAGAEHVGVETDQGGDTWESVYREALDGVLAANPEWESHMRPAFTSEKAGAGHGPKAHRASQMVPDYEKGKIVHVLGAHDRMEASLSRFPMTKPLDGVDAMFWGWHDLSETVQSGDAYDSLKGMSVRR